MNPKLPLICALILLMFSCQKQDAAFTGTVINITESIDSVFFAVNESSTGLLLFHSDFTAGTYEIPHAADVKVDFTAGYLSFDNNLLQTTREISSLYSPHAGAGVSCSAPDSGELLFTSKDYILRITGVSSLQELYVPFSSDDEQQEAFLTDDVLVIRGKMRRKNTHNFTVKTVASDTYKTYSFAYADWSEDGNTLFAEIPADNYEEFPYLDFQTGETTHATVTLHAKISESEFVTIPASGDYQAAEADDYIRIFYSPDYYDFYLRAFLFCADGSAKSTVKKYETFDENPALWKPTWDAVEKVENGLVFPDFTDADKVRVTCFYRKDAMNTLKWNIIHYAGMSPNFTFPELPAEQAAAADEFTSNSEEYFIIDGTKYPNGATNAEGYCPDNFTYRYFQEE